MRGYVFTVRERGLLLRWLESGVEGAEARKLFVLVRANLGRLTGDLELLGRVARELSRRDRLAGRAVMPRGSGRGSRSGGSGSTRRTGGRSTSGGSRG